MANTWHIRFILRLLPVCLFAVWCPWAGASAQEGQDSNQRLQAVVGIKSTVPPNARTAESLGVEREGTGVVIDDDGLVLTIGYVILEAMEVMVEPQGRNAIPAEVVAYDHESGFGLVRSSLPLNIEPMTLGDAATLALMDPLLAASQLDRLEILGVHLIDRRPFAGYWEYLLEDALFTAPPHPQFGGAALINRSGELVGIGSLFVRNAAVHGEPLPGNMFIPVDVLKPILDDLLAQGRRREPGHPWLGLYLQEHHGRVFVAAVAPGGPAEGAGMRPGDMILGVEGEPVAGLADFYRTLWSAGDAGVEVSLDLVEGESHTALSKRIKSADRYRYLRLDPTF